MNDSHKDVFMASNADEEFKNFGELDFEGKELWFSRPNARLTFLN